MSLAAEMTETNPNIPGQNETAAKSASGSSFYTAMRVLPPAERDAMFHIYAFCRAVDDIADGDDPTVASTKAARREALDKWRRDIAAVCEGKGPAKLAGLQAATLRFALRYDDFIAVIDGMQMDLDADIQAPDMATLDLYCDRVASAVGRLSVRVFGMPEDSGIALSHHLGRALQLTNVLRDVDEDAAINRLYLPAELLRKHGITATDPNAVVADPRIDGVARDLAVRAAEHFVAADRLLAAAPRRAARAPRLMRDVYKVYLDRLLVRGWAGPRPKVRIAKPHLLWIVLKAFLF
ncbi:presqualene diphosphate synthase HpnD [Nitrospirillum sp. BR 11163]|uniref:presqualene diphosphate synthase HpnD n=1 Tax=Nitrospirillum sp. BR 11163 TaxID=3104323 RepID=UPI002AFF2F71|nr:presqualene diphosphate synthase HpnD [Nitrospirillum sp. BR 11163]MEA1672306.1 presqualene diphosphate synthase HpnD [Nitrospirillum sp. BR 11163]